MVQIQYGVPFMSRSYKKNPWSTDHKCKTTKNKKRFANQTVRRRLSFLEELPTNHGFSKRMTPMWEICDYKCRETKQEAIDYWTEESNNIHNPHFLDSWPTLNDYMSMWNREHYRK